MLTGVICEVGRAVYAQLAAVAPEVGRRVGYVEDVPQSHQLVGLNHAAPSAIQVGVATIDAFREAVMDPEFAVPVTKVELLTLTAVGDELDEF